jgi:ABC-2 type transport system ATP-binding protein
VCGFDVASQPLEVKRRIGYVPETGAVYPTLSPTEYLTLVGTLHGMERSEIADRTRRMLELFGIEECADRRLDTLSKGQRQRVVISGALLPDPEVILFDEPLSGLDANAARTIRDLVRELADRGKTVLYCSHVLDVVERLCERVIILHHGQIVADGKTSELLQQSRAGTLESVFRELTAGEAEGEMAKAIAEVVHQEAQAISNQSKPRRR